LQKVITDDLSALLDILPEHIYRHISEQSDVNELIEIVMDLGRPPEARFFNHEMVIIPQDVTELDLEFVVSRISSFGEDNRAGIERTLHRISAIRNRKGTIVGLTCRVGRAVYGTIKIIQDLVESGIFYAAIFPQESGPGGGPSYRPEEVDALPVWEPAAGLVTLPDVLRVLDLRGTSATLFSDIGAQECRLVLHPTA